MRILLLGCNGLLGQNLIARAPSDSEIYGASIEPDTYIKPLAEYQKINLGDQSALQSLISRVSPDLIINAAAITNVDLCETEREQCGLINRDAVGWMADTLVPLVHFSTDYVFNGEDGPYGENDAVDPVSYYGQTKLESESLVASANPNSLIVRTMTLWGKGNQLRPSFVEFVKSNLTHKKPVNIVTDQLGNPTLASDLALGVFALLKNKCKGIYNVCGSEIISRYDWAVKIADYYQLDKSFIQSCLTRDLNQAARRPLCSGLKIDKLIRDTGFTPGDVIQQLQENDMAT
ncbi:MAG: NAD(P)-dependent oxidoreductase [Fibrobacteria bacterium]|nr:NAD(P)-dependent oxidoreductase [Fibrobacteria bacterium]